jgi:hypothetical protein
MRPTKRRTESVCKSNVRGSDKPSESTRQTEKRSSKRNKRLSASASNRSRPLDGCNAGNSRDRSRRNKPTSVRRASVPEKNASRYESNAVFGTRKFNGSERLDSFARWSGLHGAPLWPFSPRHFSRGSKTSVGREER